MRHITIKLFFVIICCIFCHIIESFRNTSTTIIRSKQIKYHVMIIHNAGLTETRGGDNHVYATIQAFVELHHHVTLWFSSHQSNDMLNLIELGVDVKCGSSRVLEMKLLSGELKYDIVVEFLWESMYYLRQLRYLNLILKEYLPSITIIVLNPDTLHLRVQKEHQASRRDCSVNCRMYKDVETYFWRNADIIVGVNEEITLIAQKLTPNSTVFHLPFAQPDIESPSLSFSERSGLIYFGNHNGANKLAAEWLVTNIAPAVLARHSAHLHLYGRIQAKEVNGTKVHGRTSTEALHNAIVQSRWMVAPVFTDVGVSTKILRALALGTPVVTTPQGLGGMEKNLLGGPLPIVVANISDFAAVVLAVYNDRELWETKAALAKSFVSEHFGQRKLVSRTSELISLVETKKESKLSHRDDSASRIVPLHQHHKRELKGLLKVMWDVPPSDSLSPLSSIHNVFPYLSDSFEFIVSHSSDCSSSNTSRLIDVYIRIPEHFPDLTRPPCCPSGSCHFILYFPWNYGMLPTLWIEKLQTNVDTIWALSNYQASSFWKSLSLNSHRHEDDPAFMGVALSLDIRTIPFGISSCANAQSNLPTVQNTHRSSLGILKYQFVSGFIAETQDDQHAIDILVYHFHKKFASAKNLVLLVFTMHNETLQFSCPQYVGFDRIIYLNNSNIQRSDFFKLIDVYVHVIGSVWNLNPVHALVAGTPVVYSWGILDDYLINGPLSMMLTSFDKPCRGYPCKNNAICHHSYPLHNNLQKDKNSICVNLAKAPSLLKAWMKLLWDKSFSITGTKRKHRIDILSTRQYYSDYICSRFSWQNISQLMLYHIRDSAKGQGVGSTHIPTREMKNRWKNDKYAPFELHASSLVF